MEQMERQLDEMDSDTEEEEDTSSGTSCARGRRS